MRILIITGGRIDESFALSLLQKEKFVPFFTIVSFSFEVVMAILFCLAESLLYILVVKDAIASSFGGSTIGCSVGTCVTLESTLF